MLTAVKFFAVPAAFFLLHACAPSRLVKPLEKKQHAVSASFGGPLIHFAGAIIPLPFTTAGCGYGLSNNTSIFANLHTTSLLFGNIQADLGFTSRIWEKAEVFGFSASPALQVAWSARTRSGFRCWPSLDVNAYFHLSKKKSFLYTGWNSWLEASAKKAHEEPRSRLIVPNLHLGYMIVRTKCNHQFELKYLGLGIPNLPNVAYYAGISGKGSLGFYYSFTRRF